MTALHVCMGISGSGKSEYAKELAKRYRAIVISSDAIRQELFGDAGKQKRAALVFQTAYERIDQALAEGRHVVFDATNLDREKRVKMLKRYEREVKHGYLLDTPYSLCLSRNQERRREVSDRILQKMMKNFQFPLLGEGWDELHLIHTDQPYALHKQELMELLQQEADYETLYGVLQKLDCFKEMIGFNQDNPHHRHTLCRHTYQVLEYVNAFYEEEDKQIMQLTALFHDVGKPFCKTFKPLRGYHSYYGHEHVSALIAVHVMKQLGFTDEELFKVASLIEMHMQINHGDAAEVSEIYRLLGDEYLWKLYFFKEADQYAK